MTKIILCGCSGKMGSVIAELCQTDEEIEIVAGVDTFDNEKNKFPVFESFENVDVSADVIIDFSNPAVLDSLLTYALKTNTAVVLAITGYD